MNRDTPQERCEHLARRRNLLRERRRLSAPRIAQAHQAQQCRIQHLALLVDLSVTDSSQGRIHLGWHHQLKYDCEHPAQSLLHQCHYVQKNPAPPCLVLARWRRRRGLPTQAPPLAEVLHLPTKLWALTSPSRRRSILAFSNHLYYSIGRGGKTIASGRAKSRQADRAAKKAPYGHA